MTRYKVIVADDEPVAREGLQVLLKKDSSIEVVAICRNGVEAIEAIESYHPDIVLLDIQMPEVNGFDVLRSLSPPLPQVIFITAFDQYAIEAFSHHALDYLLKPFTDERFYTGLARAKEMVDQRQASGFTTRVLELLQTNTAESMMLGGSKTTAALQKLVVKDSGKVVLIPWEEIVFIKADDYVVRIQYLGKVTVVRERLKRLETILPSDRFVRTHKSFIVNLSKVVEVENDLSGGLILRLSDKSEIPVSKLYRDSISQKLGIS